MALSFSEQRFRAPAECNISVNGASIAELHSFLTEVTVDCTRDEASAATLVFSTRREETGRWLVQDAGILEPWAPVKIDVVFGGRREEVMRGYVREVVSSYPADAGAASVRVECQDDSLLLDREHVRKTWGGDAPTTDGIIVGEILQGRGLRLAPDSGAGLSGLVLHQDGTDIRFLRARAEANGYELLFQKGQVYFGPMRLEAQAQPTLMVYAGPDTCCRSFTIVSDGHRPEVVAYELAPTEGSQVETREVRSNLKPLGRRLASAGVGLPPFVWRLTRQGSADQDELSARAQRQVNEAALRIRAEGEVDGSVYGHILQVGLPVGVDGVGDWLGGTYYVDRVTHSFTAQGYRQSVGLLRNGYGDDLADAAQHPLRGIL